jgi:ABC-type transport system involved in cytochrome c biogenesis permease subunit
MIALLAAPLYLAGLFYYPLLFIALTFQGVYILWRGLSLERLPLVGLHDTLLFLSFSTVLFSLSIVRFLRERKVFLQAVALLAFVFSVAGGLSPEVNTPLPPVLRTYWFELHVVLSFLSYALFGLGAILGVLEIWKRLAEVEPIQYRVILIGYLFFSLSMVFGGIWAYLAWGTYWLWTPKEIWTTLLWLVYTLYLHLRLIQGWKGSISIKVGILGYAVVLFTYLGVGLLMKSSHSF